jgi:hypothetical protein
VARYIVDAIDSSRTHQVVGRQAGLYVYVMRHFPGFGRFLSRKMASRFARTADELRADPELQRRALERIVGRGRPAKPKRRT